MQNAGVGIRAVATIIDIVILMVIGWVVALFTGGTTDDGFALQGPGALLYFIVAMGYYIVMEARMGYTVGKLAVGLRVVRADGTPLDWPSAVVRNLLRIVDGLFFYLVGAILVWTSDRRQRLGDRVASTVVVRAGSAPA
jgi:uncharacterized RDD family membrane protein YckC